MQQLQELASFAAVSRIQGRSFKRNALLKPLDMILVRVEREPKASADQDPHGFVRAACKEEIAEHIRRLGFLKSREKEVAVHRYVDLFFDRVLGEAHRWDVNRLLEREDMLRSAYLVYFRAAIPLSQKMQAEKDREEEAATQDAGTTLDADEVDEEGLMEERAR